MDATRTPFFRHRRVTRETCAHRRTQVNKNARVTAYSDGKSTALISSGGCPPSYTHIHTPTHALFWCLPIDALEGKEAGAEADMSVRGATLSGRKELLQWLNSLCDAEYPAVESLRDGAAYCTIVEAAIGRIAQNCAAVQSPETPVATSRAEQAHAYLAKLDWSATPVVCEATDPSLDSVAVHDACLRNNGLLQDMLQDCVPPEYRTAVDTHRLAAGKLQDHVVLLRWLYTFMSKVLAQYSKKALEKRAGVVVGAVEGVRLNRTARLRSGQSGSTGPHTARASSARSRGPPADLPRSGDSIPPQSSSARQSPPQPSPRAGTHRDTREVGPGRSTSPPRTPPRSGDFAGHTQEHGPASARTPRSSRDNATTPPPAPISASAEEVLRERTVHAHYTRGTITVPEAFRTTLVSMRNQVEELEGHVLRLHEFHNTNLTRRTAPSVGQGGGVSADSGDRVMLSLEELGELLEERDRLAHQYAAVDAIVSRVLEEARRRGTPVTPLLRDVVELLRPA